MSVNRDNEGQAIPSEPHLKKKKEEKHHISACQMLLNTLYLPDPRAYKDLPTQSNSLESLHVFICVCIPGP